MQQCILKCHQSCSCKEKLAELSNAFVSMMYACSWSCWRKALMQDKFIMSCSQHTQKGVLAPSVPTQSWPCTPCQVTENIHARAPKIMNSCLSHAVPHQCSCSKISAHTTVAVSQPVFHCGRMECVYGLRYRIFWSTWNLVLSPCPVNMG